MKLIVLSALFVVALATRSVPDFSWERETFPSSSIKENRFRPSREYRFVYNGQLATGIPGSSKQHSSTRLQALVSLVCPGQESCLLQIQEIRMGRLNRRLPNPRAMIPFPAFEQVSIQERKEQILKKPVQFIYRQGLVDNVIFDGEEQPWSANIKRGILNMLQVNLKAQNRIDSGEEARLTNKIEPAPKDPSSDFFTVLEKTLEGECETQYTVVSEPSPFSSSQPVLNVTKSIDFEKCRRRPEVKYNHRFQDPCPTCDPKYSEDEKYLKSSSVFRFNITGSRDRFLIESAIVDSQYSVVPFGRQENVITTYVNQTLVLVTAGPIQSQIPEPKNPIPSDTQMLFTLDWAISKEKFFMEEDTEFKRSSPYSKPSNVVQFVSSILRRLTHQLRNSVEPESPELYVRLVKSVRWLSRSELKQVHQQLFQSQPRDFTPAEHQMIKSLLVDALSDACTKISISHLVEKIQKRDISPIKAAISIKSLVNCKVVSKEMIQDMIELAESQICRSHPYLKNSVWLTVGSMINAVCSPSEDKYALESLPRQEKLCSQQFRKSLTQKLMEKYEQSQKLEDQILYLKTLGNAGLDMSILELEKIIKCSGESERCTPTLRTEAISALRQLKGVLPNKIRKILMPIFMDNQEPTPVRLMAVYMTLESLPERPTLDQIASKLFRERNSQIASFVYSYMSSIANSTNPCLKQQAKDMRLSLRHGRKIAGAFRPGYTRFWHTNVYSQKYRTGLDLEYGVFQSRHSPIPRAMMLRVNWPHLGFWTKNFLKLSWTSTNLDKVVREYINQWSVQTPHNQKLTEQMQQIFRKLKIQEREYPSEAAFSKLSFFYKDQLMFYQPFSVESFSQYIQEIIQSEAYGTKSLDEWIRSVPRMNWYKAVILHERSFEIPTSLGLPLIASMEMPALFKLSGQVSGKLSWRLTEINPEGKISFASSIISRLQAWNPIVDTGLKLKLTAQANVPLDLKVRVQLGSEPKVNLVWSPPRQSTRWLTLESRPTTYTRVWPQSISTWLEPDQKTIMGEEHNRMYNFQEDFPVISKVEEICEKVFGIQMRVSGTWHHSPQKHLTGTPIYLMAGPNHLIVSTRPTPQTPKEIVLELTGRHSSQSQPLKSSFTEFPSEHSFEGQQSWSSVLKAVLKTKGSPKDFSCDLEGKLTCGPQLRYCKIRAELNRPRIPDYSPTPFKMCMESEMLYPETPNTFSELSGKKMISQMRLNWGRNCQSDKFLNINMQGERSPAHQRYLEEQHPRYSKYNNEEYCKDKESCSPLSVYDTLHEASHLMKYKINCDYQHVPPSVKNVTNKIYRLLKHVYYGNSDVNQIQVQNPSHKLQMTFSIDPKTKRNVNITIKTPEETCRFSDIPLPMKPLNLRRRDSVREFVDYVIARPSCRITSNGVRTFDGVSLPLPLAPCWSILAQDCQSSEQPQFVVLAKSKESNSAQKVLKIVTSRREIILSPESEDYGRIKVQVDGERVNVQSEGVISVSSDLSLEKEGSYVKVYLSHPGLTIYYDGYTAEIKMSPLLSSVQCGLCGHYNQELLLPNSQPTSDLREYWRQYTLEDNCEPSPVQPQPEVLIRNEGDNDCDCSYFRVTAFGGGCRIVTPAPVGWKCCCRYDGFFTCSGHVVQCEQNETCPVNCFAKSCCQRCGSADCGGYP